MRMRCQYCGREAQPGQVYCECGHPISIAAGTNPYGASYGYDEPPSNYDKNWYTPDGRSLSDLEKKSGMGAGAKILIMLIVLLALGAGAFFAYKFIKGQEVLDQDNWEKHDLGGYTITLPSAMKEEENIIELNQNCSKIGFFTSDKAAVYILEYQLTADEKEKLSQQGGVQTLRQNLMNLDSRRTVNGQKLEPKQRGDLICVEYSATKKNYIKETDDLWIVSGTLITTNGMYEIEAYCPKEQKDKYVESMYKWIESFKEK